MYNTARTKKYNLVAIFGLLLNLIALVAAIYKYRSQIKSAIKKILKFAEGRIPHQDTTEVDEFPKVKLNFPKPITQRKPAQPAVKVAAAAVNHDLNPRQQAALTLVNQAKEVTVTDVMSVVGEQVTNRTIRRDMDKLESLGFVKQVGKTKNAVYKLV